MSSTHYRSARDHLTAAEGLAGLVGDQVDKMKDGIRTKSDTEAPGYIAAMTESMAMTIDLANLACNLAKVHIALAGCPVD